MLKIRLKLQKSEYLFDVVNNLGMENQLFQAALSDSTYQAFLQDLKFLCSKIIIRKAKANYMESLP